jgi:inner membrane protein
VDNLCHSLVGAALSGAGLRRRTGLATLTMVIGANLPDVDALVYLWGGGARALAFRRGWTHGVLAMIVLPIVLAGAILLISGLLEAHRSRQRSSRRSRSAAQTPVRPAQLLLISAIAVWSHPLFDLLNTYGVRLLMPFSGRWFYGDALFIVDPWVWCALGLGATISLRRARRVPIGAGTATVMARVERPARVALAAVAVYIAVMMGSSALARGIVERQAVAAGTGSARHVMVGPEPLTPLRRGVVRELDARYEPGRFTWSLDPRYQPSGREISANLADVDVRRAAATPEGRRFLTWSRFPFAETVEEGDSVMVRFDDARYATPGQQSWASLSVKIARPMPPPS